MRFKYLMKLKLGHSNPKYFHVSKLVPSPAPFRASFTLLKTFAHLSFPFGVDKFSVWCQFYQQQQQPPEQSKYSQGQSHGKPAFDQVLGLHQKFMYYLYPNPKLSNIQALFSSDHRSIECPELEETLKDH